MQYLLTNFVSLQKEALKKTLSAEELECMVNTFLLHASPAKFKRKTEFNSLFCWNRRALLAPQLQRRMKKKDWKEGRSKPLLQKGFKDKGF